MDSNTDFVVDTRAVTKKRDSIGKVTCNITNPSGIRIDNLITPLADGTYKVIPSYILSCVHTGIERIYNLILLQST